MSGQRFTMVSFHAHPDDEALLTGGLLARTAAQGHRVVLVTATAGERGLAGERDGSGDTLAGVRMTELAASARILGCARVVGLGLADSGLDPGPDSGLDPGPDSGPDSGPDHGLGGPESFSRADVARCAADLAAVLRDEQADVLTIYDPNGGYGHPDHVQVHRVGVLAARLAGTPVVLEATVPGRLFSTGLRLLALLGHPLGASPVATTRVFADPGTITHRVGVRGALRQKRAAMAAHGSQRRGGGGVRALDRFARLPLPLFWVVFGREWYVEHGRRAPDRLEDVFASLRD